MFLFPARPFETDAAQGLQMDAAGHAAPPTENEEAAVAVGVTPSTGQRLGRT